MAETFAHAMPFGAQVLPDGRTRLQLWAPSQEALALVLEQDRQVVPMNQLDDGFFAVTTEAPAGSRYRYQLETGAGCPTGLAPSARGRFRAERGDRPRTYAWQHAAWRGRPWHETVLYELHVGAFTEQGTFDGLRRGSTIWPSSG